MREIGLIVAGLLVMALVLQSFRASHYSGQVDEMRGSLASEREQVSACVLALDAVNAVTAEAVADGARREQEGAAAAQAALQAARVAEMRARDASRALDAARNDPDCGAVLSANICPRVTLL